MFTLIKGILYGVIIGVLIAPDKGVETRKKIVKFFTDTKEDAKDIINASAEKPETDTQAAE